VKRLAANTNFLDIKRENFKETPPAERVRNWQEYQKLLPAFKLQQQASRCMDCGTPFCQMGTVLQSGTSGCPLYNLIPEWNQLVNEGKWHEAYLRLAKTNNFPEFTSRACPAPCEGSCTAGLASDPVTIKSIEKAIIDKAFQQGWVAPRQPKLKSGKKIAVIGSGPAGLTAADDLNQAGHSVTIYEKADRFGGLLMYGIPNMKLDKASVERRIELLKAEGIQFIGSTEIGKDISLEELQTSYDAVLLCIGAEKPRQLTIEGCHLKGIHAAMDYLTLSTKHYLNKTDGEPFISAKGKRVVVIGGGDTGADCVATAIRQGCKSVAQFGKYGQLSTTRESHNPWPENPQVFTLDYAYEEAKDILGEDPRQYFIQTKSFIGNENGEVMALETVPFNRPEAAEGENRIWEAELVLIAIGFEGVLSENLPVIETRSNRIKTADNGYQTNVEGVFAAGDARRGQSLIVWAMQEGKKAAVEIGEFLCSRVTL
jgi:glutamate synthase (NADPH/NADH) small chain